MSRIIKILELCLLAILGVLSVCSPLRGQTTAGTVITSQASLNYIDPVVFTSWDLYSNTVVTTVTRMPAFTLVEDRSVVVAPNAYFTLPHQLQNTGNTIESFTLRPELLAASQFTPENMALVIDSNGNQSVDSGEAQLAFAPYTFTLPPGGQLDFIIMGLVPGSVTAASSQQASFEIEAELDSTGATLRNNDVVTTGLGSIQLFKSASQSKVSRGGRFSYNLTGTNNYPSALSPITLLVDGILNQSLLVRDELPPNLMLTGIVSGGPATVLYHTAGDPFHTYSSTQPADLSQVDAIAFAYASIGPSVSFSVDFEVEVGNAASGVIENTGEFYFQDGASVDITRSNPALVTVPGMMPEIEFHRDASFNEVIPATKLGSPLYIEVTAGDCNRSSTVAETITVILTSALTGDEEQLIGLETGPNTGVFHLFEAGSLFPVPTQDAAVFTVTQHDGIMQTLPQDSLTAEITSCGGVTVTANILIDPAGIVYDSRTNDEIEGAIVRLIDVSGAGNGGNPGGLASVLDEDGVTPVSAEQTTGPDGMFRFPLVSPSQYRLEVIPPDGYTFPSEVPAGAQPAGRHFEVLGSRGFSFSVNASTGAVFLDVPLDATQTDTLTLEKTVSTETADIGDSVIYSLTLTNESSAPYTYTFIDDTLPSGFRYERGSTRLDGVKVADPVGGIGPDLRFAIGTLEVDQEVTLQYRVRLSFGAEKGSGINTAQAVSFGPPVLRSNVATAKVKVGEGVFDSRATIIGTVFVDLNDDGIQNDGEPGIPGVRLVLEDGTYVITDSNGQYSIYGQRPITHVLKLDRSTLPVGAELGGRATRFAGDPGSRFVDLKRSELHKANFMVVNADEALLEQVEARSLAAQKWTPEINTVLNRRITADGVFNEPGDVMGREAAGVIGGGRNVGAAFDAVIPDDRLNSNNSNLPLERVVEVPVVDLEAYLPKIVDGELDFLMLKDGDRLARSRATVRIKGPLESRLELYLNDELVPESKIGMALEQAEPALQAMEYVALRLNPGVNQLAIVQYDLFGNERGRKTIHVTAPDKPAKLSLYLSDDAPVADGRTPLIVTVAVEDENGGTVTAPMLLTLDSSLGRWDVDDVSEDDFGTQVFLDGGRGTYALLPPIEPGASEIHVTSGSMRAEASIDFLPELRPMIASGIIEGRLNFGSLSNNDILPLDPFDAFEESFSDNKDFGSGDSAQGRAAFYLKGKISGKTLLTIAYDSDKDTDEVELFRDLDPDAFYPVYGDSSVRGYDAQSTGKLYVRIDRGRSYFLLGDMNTRARNEVRELGDYNRSVNGVRLHHESARVEAEVWASDDSTTQIIREIPANGTSGPFNFQSGQAVYGSEVVEILVRDRNQSSVILSTEQLTRNFDYEFEPFSGNILLRRPVPSVDANFNPQSIRITYEVEGNGDRFWVYGGDLQFKVTDFLEVGGSFARDENPLETYQLQSLNSTLKIGSKTYLITEVAQSDDMVEGVGNAGRVELLHKGEDTEARVYLGATEESFENPASSLNGGRIEGTAKVTQRIGEQTHLITEAIHSVEQNDGGRLSGARVDVARTLKNDVTVTVGARVSEETNGESSAAVSDPGGSGANLNNVADTSVRSVRLRVDTPVPGQPTASVFGEYEQDVVIKDQRMAAVGGTWQKSSKTKLYGRHEFISSLGSNFDLNRTQRNNRTIFGVETEYLKNASFFNEYRVDGALDGEQSETSTGLRNGWTLADGLRMNTTFERITPMDGVTSRESTAFTVAADYTALDDWKFSGRVETRFADASDTFLNTFGMARRIDEEWTLLARSIINTQTSSTSEDLFQGRLLSGLAYRQHGEDQLNALMRYEYKYEDGAISGSNAIPGQLRHVHQLAMSANYQVNRDLILSGTWATKYVWEEADNFGSTDYIAQMLVGRILYDLTERWDAGLNLGITFSDSFSNRQYSVGPEIGFRAKENVRIGLGYNITGFSDQDFDTSATARGLFLSLRIKFDEGLFKWADFSRKDHTE